MVGPWGSWAPTITERAFEARWVVRPSGGWGSGFGLRINHGRQSTRQRPGECIVGAEYLHVGDSGYERRGGFVGVANIQF